MNEIVTPSSTGVIRADILSPGDDRDEVNGDRLLTGWAADSAYRALAGFGDQGADARVLAALAAACAWADGSGDVDACREAAFEAQLAARDAQDDGYRALATAYRAAASAAASVDDSRLATDAAALAAEAITSNSAPCEQDFNAGTERRRQWEALPETLRPSVFAVEPPDPAPAACAIEVLSPGQ